MNKPAASTRKAPAPVPQRGNMKPAEIKPLAIAARRAFDFQRHLGNLDDATDFDTWRHEQVMTAVNKPGLSALNHRDFRPVLAHFQTLAGQDDKAFASHMRSGPVTDHAAPGDTREARETQVHLIAVALQAHIRLADTPLDLLLDEADPSFHASIRARRASIEAKGKGPIGIGYLVWLARQKTRRPDLTLGNDWQAGLADRLTLTQLTQLRDTLINRINATEGVGFTKTRNKKQTEQQREKRRCKDNSEPLHLPGERPGF